ncbi:MAG: SGNH/GDSL hydrolase family protein [Hydrococcus sp. Prado102]|nr:SGNH/GDSL hydrolase family protein [Hydrococcus sp. Prado102]
MTFRKQALATGFVLFSFMLPLEATAANFSQLFVFGDSLSDTGNFFDVSSGQFPPASLGYFNRRFSNGPIWIDYLAQDLGVSTPTPVLDLANGSPANGINYALGGATTGTVNSIDPRLFGLQQEIGSFSNSLIQNNQTADPNALYIVWAGANDYLASETPVTTPDLPVANIAGAVNALAGVGAKNIMVVNLPDLGITPRANGIDPLFPVPAPPPGTPDRLNRLTEAHNALLSTTLSNLSSSLKGQNVNLISLDVNSLLEDVTDPARSPLINTTDTCLLNPLCTNPDEFLFWDGLHPTTAGHRLIGQLAFESVQTDGSPTVPEPASILGILAIGALGAGTMAKRNLSKRKTQTACSTTLVNRL